MDYLKKTGMSWNLNVEALDRNVWRAYFVKGCALNKCGRSIYEYKESVNPRFVIFLFMSRFNFWLMHIATLTK